MTMGPRELCAGRGKDCGVFGQSVHYYAQYSDAFGRSSVAITASDVVPFTQARANLSELADQVKAGAEKIITRNGESCAALIGAERLDH
jgi:prevent-host-death family protein